MKATRSFTQVEKDEVFHGHREDQRIHASEGDEDSDAGRGELVIHANGSGEKDIHARRGRRGLSSESREPGN